MLLCEYNGEQHTRPMSFSKKRTTEQKKEEFNNLIIRDKLKIDYAENNNIPLLIIKHTEFKIIPELLSNFLKLNSAESNI